MPLHTLGQMCRPRGFFPSCPFRHGDLGKISTEQHPTQAPTGWTAAPIPKARGDCCRCGSHIREAIAGQQRPLQQAVAARAPKHACPVRADHLLGREGDLLDRPAVTGQTPPRSGGHRQRRCPHQRFAITRIVDAHPPQSRPSRRRGRQHPVGPDVGLDPPPASAPLRGSIGRRGGHPLPFLGAGPRTDPLPRARATAPALVGREDIPPGRAMASDPRPTVWDTRRQQGRHAASGVDPEHCVGLPGGSCLRDRSALPSGFPLGARVATQSQTDQREADGAYRTDRRAPRNDHGWQGFVGPGLGGLPATPAPPWAEEADQGTGHGAKPVLPMRLPTAFLLDDLGPRFDERLDGPATRCQRCTRAAHGLCWQSPVGERREDGPPTAQKPTREQRPEEPEQPQIRPNRPLGSSHTQQARKTINYGRHRASLQE